MHKEGGGQNARATVARAFCPPPELLLIIYPLLNANHSIPWSSKPIESVVTDSTGGQTKILRSDYETAGAFPVIDQGKEFSNGFTSDESKLYRGKLPLVLFGDHTREIKFVDQRFALGADGVKALEPKPILAAKFLYYYLLKSPVEARGYSRHFKYLKEKNVPLPPLPEQDRIVEILDQADALRQQRRQADALSQRILPALFHEMFGDLRRNKSDWDTSDLGELTEIVSGITKGRRTNETNLREVAYLSVVNVQDGHLRMDNVKVIEASEAEIKRYQLRLDDLVLTEGGDPDKLGRGALWSCEISECIHQNHVFRVRIASPRILPLFLSALTASEYGKSYFFSVAKKTTGIASINKRQLSAFPVVIPPIDIQQKFAKALGALNTSIDTQTTSAATLETLFQTLLHRAFAGSLTAKWREGHSKELLQEMERKASQRS